MNLPNKLTVLRVIMIPFFLFFYFGDFIGHHMFIALIIFMIASFTDMLDGKIARKNNLVTNFGKLMDPLADKLLVTAAMVCVMGFSYSTVPGYPHIVFILCLIVSISRDLVVNSIRLVAASEGTVIAADIFGKMKTVLQMVWLCVAMLELAIGNLGVYNSILHFLSLILFWGMMAMTVISGINYIIKNKSVFADA